MCPCRGYATAIVAAQGRAGTRKNARNNISRKTEFASQPTSNDSSYPYACMPGVVSISPAPNVTGVNTTASIGAYGPNALHSLFQLLKASLFSPSSSTLNTLSTPPILQVRALMPSKLKKQSKVGTTRAPISVSAPRYLQAAHSAPGRGGA